MKLTDIIERLRRESASAQMLADRYKDEPELYAQYMAESRIWASAYRLVNRVFEDDT